MLEDERLIYRHFKVPATKPRGCQVSCSHCLLKVFAGLSRWPVGLKRNIAVILATGALGTGRGCWDVRSCGGAF